LSAGAKVEERSDEIPPWRGKKCDNLSRFFIEKAGNNLPLLSVSGLVFCLVFIFNLIFII